MKSSVRLSRCCASPSSLESRWSCAEDSVGAELVPPESRPISRHSPFAMCTLAANEASVSSPPAWLTASLWIRVPSHSGNAANNGALRSWFPGMICVRSSRPPRRSSSLRRVRYAPASNPESATSPDTTRASRSGTRLRMSSSTTDSDCSVGRPGHSAIQPARSLNR